MKIADQMGEHEERFLLVLDGERSRRGVVFQYRYRGGDCRDEVVFVRSQVASVKSVTLEGHVVKMVGVVAPSFFSPRSVAALRKISPDVVRPGSGDAQRNRHALIRRIFVTQDLRYLSLRIVVQHLVCD